MYMIISHNKINSNIIKIHLEKMMHHVGAGVYLKEVFVS